MTAEFYLQTIDTVFQDHSLPKGTMEHRGRRVDPAAITDIAHPGDRGRARRHFGPGPDEGGADDRDRPARREEEYLMAEGAGHYGIFNGSRWRNKIAPVVEQWIARLTPKPSPRT